jgi:hypothetical protein
VSDRVWATVGAVLILAVVAGVVWAMYATIAGH